MATKAKTSKKSVAKPKVKAKRGKGTQPESAVLKEQKPRKVASLRVGGAQRSAAQKVQKKRDTR